MQIGAHVFHHYKIYNLLGKHLNDPWRKTCQACISRWSYSGQSFLKTHWGRVTHICVSKLTIIGSEQWLVSWKMHIWIQWTLQSKCDWNVNHVSVPIILCHSVHQQCYMFNEKLCVQSLSLDVVQTHVAEWNAALLESMNGDLLLFGITLHERQGVWDHQPLECLFVILLGLTSKKQQRPHYWPFCEENSSVTGGFLSQRAAKAESVSISRLHNGWMHWMHEYIECMQSFYLHFK